MSPAQSDASRINGAKSNGPVTEEGKAVSAMNSLKHGLCSKQAVLPGEDPEAFERLRADYIRRYRPQGPAELELVETIAAASWRLKRIMRIENALFNDDNTDALKALNLLVRYENQLNRTYDQSVKRLQELQENRPKVTSGDAVRNEPKQERKSEVEIMREVENIMRAPLPNGK